MANDLILFVDTETTGFVHTTKPLNEEVQPHPVEIALRLGDQHGQVGAAIDMIVRSPIDIPEKASAVHGISTETSRRFGVGPATALGIVHAFAQQAGTIVCHNTDFDLNILEILRLRHGPAKWETLAKGRRIYCTMKEAMPILRLPKPISFQPPGDQFKWPNLAEAYKHFTGAFPEVQHRAGADVEACMVVYYAIQKVLGVMPAGAPKINEPQAAQSATPPPRPKAQSNDDGWLE